MENKKLKQLYETIVDLPDAVLINGRPTDPKYDEYLDGAVLKSLAAEYIKAMELLDAADQVSLKNNAILTFDKQENSWIAQTIDSKGYGHLVLDVNGDLPRFSTVVEAFAAIQNERGGETK